MASTTVFTENVIEVRIDRLYSRVAQWWSRKLLTSRLPVRVRPREPLRTFFMEKYSINNQTVSILLSWVQSGVVAIREIQRPFVWSKAQVRNLMDSLYQGYPVGYIITCKTACTLKMAQHHRAKCINDGQQRITALELQYSAKR